MKYLLTELKNLYNKYIIKEDSVFERDKLNEVKDEKIVNCVKFIYLWIYATHHNYFKLDFNDIADKKDDYSIAFDEEAEYLYDLIMEISKEYLNVTNDIIKCEALINFVLEDEDITDNVVSIIQTFYANDNNYQIFENFIKN